MNRDFFTVTFPIVECAICGKRSAFGMCKVLGAEGSYCGKHSYIAFIHARRYMDEQIRKDFISGLVTIPTKQWVVPKEMKEAL